MNITNDEFATYAILEILKLKAENEALRKAISASFELMKPGSSNIFLTTFEKLVDSHLKKLVEECPYIEPDRRNLLKG